MARRKRQKRYLAQRASGLGELVSTDTLLWIGGFAVVGAVLYLFRDTSAVQTVEATVTQAASSVASVIQGAVFKATLPSYAEQYGDVILQVSQETGVSPFLIFALGDRESGWGRFLAADGTGDNGNGLGLMQIDKRYHPDFLQQNWQDPYTNVSYAINNVYLPQQEQIAAATGLTGDDLTAAAVAAYNAGPGGVIKKVNAGTDVNVGTTGGNYSSDVLARAGNLEASYGAQTA